MTHKFLVEKIWDLQQVHILTGTSGIGKSTLLANWLNALCVGEPILGGFKPMFKTRPLYISLERHANQLEISTTGVSEWEIGGWNMKCEVMSLEQATKGMVYKRPDEALFQRVVKKYAKDFRVMCFDPILRFCSKPNDQNTVADFLVDIVVAKTLVPNNVTVIATAHPPKEREGQKVIGTRTKTAGSYAWGAYSSCGIYAEPLVEDDPESIIKLSVTPRFIKPFILHVERMGFGQIKIVDKLEDEGKDFVLSTFLSKPKIHTADLITAAKKSKISDRTVYRWLKKQQDKGLINEVGRGVYDVVKPEAGSIQ